MKFGYTNVCRSLVRALTGAWAGIALLAVLSVLSSAHAQSTVATGLGHSCAVAGTNLYCWGANDRGQLGDGTRIDRVQAVRVNGTGWSSVTTGAGHSCGIKSDGTLWCWGDNRESQLGLGLSAASYVTAPQQVTTGGGSWRVVSAGDAHSCALRAEQDAEGSLWCWGRNAQGQLGDGSNADRSVPTKLSGDNRWWTKLAVGAAHSCAIESRPQAGSSVIDRKLFCWGANSRGQLGNGNVDFKNQPLALSNQWVEVSSGREHSCGLQIASDNTLKLYCWGANGFGQLGDSTTQDRSSPVAIADPAETDGQIQTPQWQRLVGGARHSCAISNNSRLWCWGANERGQLGLGHDMPQMTPARVPSISGSPASWTAASGGGTHSCAIDGSQAVWCWGQRLFGQSGNEAGKLSVQPAPLRIAANQAWAPGLVASGGDQSCAINARGQLWCWGDGTDGQVGDGGESTRTQPVKVSVPASDEPDATDPSRNIHWTDVSVGSRLACGLKDRGTDTTTNPRHTLWCWGRTAVTASGTAGTASQPTPLAIDSPVRPTGDTSVHRDWLSVASGGQHGCAIAFFEQADAAGVTTIPHRYLYCWGDNRDGQAGQDSAQIVESPVLQVGTANDWRQVTTGTRHSCAVSFSNKLYCWGDNRQGQLGMGLAKTRSTVAQVGTDANWQSVQAAGDSSCGLKTDGSLWCWGANAAGQLGLGSYDISDLPQRVEGTADWRQVALGAQQGCGVRADGSLWCWGNADRTDDVANTSNQAQTIPIRVGAEAGWRAVSIGDRHRLATKQSGEIYSWGDNFSGQAGDAAAWLLTPRRVVLP